MTERPPADGEAGPSGRTAADQPPDTDHQADQPSEAAPFDAEAATHAIDPDAQPGQSESVDSDRFASEPPEPWSEPPPVADPAQSHDGDETNEDTQELDIPEAPLTRPSPQAEPAVIPKSVWPIWAWMMVGVAASVLAVGVLGGVLVPALILDVVSFWPGFLVTFLLAAAIWPLSKRFSSRLKATIPLLVITWLGLAVALHLSGWSELPSSAADLTGGAAEGVQTGTMSIEIDGLLTVIGTAQDELYTVEMLRRGGPVGAPLALESTPEGGLAVDIVERPESSWYAAAGWDVTLADNVTWSIALSARELSVDLTSVALEAGTFQGSGMVALGAVEADGVVTINGDVEVTIPAGVAVELTGTATVPSSWTPTETGHTSPGSGDAYEVVVEGNGAVTIVER